MSDELYIPTFNLGKFRYAVARYIKHLIRARWICEPGFLTKIDLARWELEDISQDGLSAWTLMEYAAANLADLNKNYLPRCGSGGVELSDESTPVGRLIYNVAFFFHNERGGGPEHNGTLVEIAHKLTDRSTRLDWESLANWGELSAIRDDLDQLPHPDDGSENDRRASKHPSWIDAEFSRQQHKLLVLLWGKDKVAIRQLIGKMNQGRNIADPEEALRQVKTRVNTNLRKIKNPYRVRVKDKKFLALVSTPLPKNRTIKGR